MTNRKESNKLALQIRLNKIGDNDTNFIQKLIGLFSKNANAALEILNKKGEANGLFLKQQVAHKLKSHFQLFEYLEAADLASKIENAASLIEMEPYIKKINIILPIILDELEAFK